MRYAGANYRQGRGYGRACSRKEVRRGSRAQRGEGGTRATDLPGVDASRRVGRRYSWPVGHGRAHGAERGHGQRRVRARWSRGVRARGGRRKVERRPLTSGPGRSERRALRRWLGCAWRAGRVLGRLGLSGAGRAGSEALAGAGPQGEGKESWAWVEFWVGLSLLNLFLPFILFLIQTKFEFKYKFEFKQHSNN